jgi:hypothetical protein
MIRRLLALLRRAFTATPANRCPHRDDGTMCDDCLDWWSFQ